MGSTHRTHRRKALKKATWCHRAPLITAWPAIQTCTLSKKITYLKDQTPKDLVLRKISKSSRCPSSWTTNTWLCQLLRLSPQASKLLRFLKSFRLLSHLTGSRSNKLSSRSSQSTRWMWVCSAPTWVRCKPDNQPSRCAKIQSFNLHQLLWMLIICWAKILQLQF